MNKFKLFIIIEIVLLVLLGISLVRNPIFLVVLAIGLFLGYLSNHVNSGTAQKVLQQIAIGFGVVALIMFVANGYTWLALLFPVIAAILFWKSSAQLIPLLMTQDFTNQRTRDLNAVPFLITSLKMLSLACLAMMLSTWVARLFNRRVMI